jgi:pimeloyl-ACP methyl ester carboxylesterase
MIKEIVTGKTIVLFIAIWLFVASIAQATAQSSSGSPSLADSFSISDAMDLIHSPEPTFKPMPPHAIEPSALADMGLEQVYANTPLHFIMRDYKKIKGYKYVKEGSLSTVILLRGVLSSAYLMNKSAGLLRESMNAEVIALDIRGHGQSQGTPGDVDYIDQYADDLADVISAIKKEKPDHKIILAGHSMGAMQRVSVRTNNYQLNKQ